MATALAAQLAQLASTKPQQDKYIKGKASLLFDYQKAADVANEQCLNIARSGIEALVKADKRFSPFTESLFSRSSVNGSREQLTAEENAALNATLAAFLRVLTTHYLSPAAFQVLEYCIRRYKVHVFNVNELLLCALPYHATPEFARLLVLLQLKGTPWEWLTPGQQSGAPPPRDIIVRRCVNDQAVLRVVCQGAQAVGVPGFVSKTFLSFYAVLLCEVLAASPRVTEDLLTLLLPFLAAGLKGDASREYTSATLMVLTQLLTRAQLSQEFLQVMLLDVVRSWSDLGGPTVLMMLAHLATTQPHCTTMPLKSLQVLAQEHAAVAQELASLQARQANLAPLLQLLLPAIAQALPNNPGLEPLACALLRQVAINPPSLVQAAAVQLLKAGGAAAAAGSEQPQPQHLQQVLKVFDLHYPEQLDAAINTAFQDAASSAAAGGGGDDDSIAEGSKAKKHKSSSKHKQPAASASSSSADALFAFVQTCFAGSRHEVLSPAEASSTDGQKQQQQQQALTLSLAVHAPASEMRVMALQKLDALCAAAAAAAAAGDGSSDAAGADASQLSSTRQLLQSALLSGLRDDVLAVAAAAAAAQGLAEVSGEQQLPALQYLLKRAAAVIAAGHVVDANADSSGAVGGAKEALKAARAALAAVAAVGQRAAASDADADAGAAALQQQATALLLEYVLADKRCKKLAKAAVKVALESCTWSPVLQALAAAPAVAAALEGAAADTPAAEGGAADTALAPDSKRRKKGRQTAAAAAAAAEGGDADAAAAAGGKHSGALTLNRAVVAALADAAATAGGDSGLVQQLGALLSTAGPRCRQLLLLVLMNAAAAAAGATAAGNTKPGSKPGGKAARGNKGAAAAAVAGDAGASSSSAPAVIANVLMQALEQQLEAAAAAAPTSKDSSSKGKGTPSATATTAVLPGSWADDAGEMLDSDSHLPTKQHMQQLPTHLPHLNAVLMLSGLHAALSAASAAALTQALGQPVQLFARLAAAASGGAPGLLQHLQLMVEKSGESPEQQLHFLSGVYGLPSSIAGEAAQAIALQLLPQAVVACSTSSSSSSTWFVRLLAAADSSSKVVRQAAVSALSALSGSLQDLGVLGKGDAAMQAAHVQELLSSLLQHEQLLRSSAGALQRLLCSAAAGGAAAMDVDAAAPASVDGTSRVRRGSKTGSGGSKAKGQQSSQQQGQDSAAAAAEAAVLQLSTDASAALKQLFAGTLPCLYNEADLLGAQLAIAVLVAGFEPGTSAEPAQQLLQQLVSKLCKHKHVPTSGASFGKGAVWQQLAAIGHGAEGVAAAAAQLQQLRSDIAASLLQFYVAEVLQSNAAVVDCLLHLLQAPFSSAAAAAVLGQHGSSVGADSGGTVLTPSQLAAVAAVRVAALQQFTPAAFDVLQPQQQQAAFTAALQTLASDGVPACRDAARGCLQQLPVSSAMLLVLLQPAGSPASATAVDAPPPTASKSKRARRASAASSSQVEQQPASGLSQDAAGQQQQHGITAAALDTAIAALEFMQWRDDVPDRQQLMQPLQQLLRLLVPLMGSIAETHQEEEQEDREADAGLGVAAAGAVAAAAGGAGGVSASAAGYAAQLVLLVLEQMVKEQLASGGGSGAAAAAAAAAGSCVDVELVLSCASAAPDGAVRNAALLLMAVLAQLSPEDVLEHVLKALAVIQHSAALQADAHSQAVATSTLSALVPAWLAAGRGSEELWGSLLGALPGLPAHRRLGLLESLLAALPQDKGLPVGLLLMMQHLVQLSTAKRAAAAAATASTPPAAAAASPGSRKGKKGKKQAAAEPTQPSAPDCPAAATAADGGDDSQAEWLPELMASLCEKVDVQQRLQAFAAVLASSLTDSQGSVAAHEPLPRLAVSFVAANLKAKSVASAISAASSAAHSGAPEAQVALQESCQAIMTQALQHLLQLNPSSSTQDGSSSSKQSRRLHKAINAASEGVYSLLAALEAVQDCPSYLLALVQMSKQSSDSVQRRALKLLGDRLAKAQIDMADLEASTTTLPAAARQAAMQELGEAGLAVCAELPRLLSPASPAVTKQLALVAADAGIRLFGKLLHPVVLASMLEVLKVVGNESAPVRASALACIASGVSALGVHLVPLLPSTAMAVLAAAEAAAQELAAAQAGSSGADSDGEQQDGDDDSAATAALQLAGSVAALDALVNNLGAFMSPYLPRLLQLLVHRQVLACTVAGANAVAGRLRSTLPTKIPARLLLQPLLQQWDGALAACAGGSSSSDSGEQQAVDVDAAPAVALLDLMGAFASSLQPSDAAVYHEQLAGLLLQGLGTRSRWLAAAALQQQAPSAAAAAAAASAGADAAGTAAAAAAAIAGFGSQDVYQIEVSAVRALAALVMKLSESRFKPMFLRMVDWTNAAAAAAKAGGADAQHPVAIGRVAALFAAVCTLSERLRSVFAPYYKYFFTLLMQQLAGEGLTGSSKRSKKKRKLSAAADAAAGGDSSSSDTAAVLSAWLARLRAVRAVHLLALHEGSHDSPAAQQEQQERFDRLMPLLVEVLQEGPPAAVAAQLSVQGADASLDLPNSPVAALGAVGAAVVEAGGGRAMQESCDIVGTAAVGALVQMAVAGGSDVVWKPLHHALLLATRGGSTRAKLLALGGVSRLADLLREDYLNLLPEALGFIAELVEDGEVAVEAAAQGLLAQMEALSGESLEQYLKAS